MNTNKPRLLFLITEDWHFWSHRLSWARAARDAGYQVIIATRVTQYGERIKKEGFKLLPIRLQRGSKNPFKELLAIMEIIIFYYRERPDIVCHVSIKPILYGSWAARLTSVPAVVNLLTGLGYLYMVGGIKGVLLQKCLNIAYKTALLMKKSKIIFQNPDDASMFLDAGVVSPRNLVVIKGSGVDISTYKPIAEVSGIPLVILASRMLWDKGVQEFVDAAKILQSLGVKAQFALVGESDIDNPTAIPRLQLETWQKENVVEWWGNRNDMPNVFAQCHIVCLPSYREGLPKALIEAASCGRAIVTTDAPGCREIVRHGENGLLVPVRDSKRLAEALKTLIEDPVLRARMGARGREIVVAEFSEEKVIEQTLAVYRELLEKHGRTG